MLDLSNSNFLKVGEVKRPSLHEHTKIRKDRSNRCGDIDTDEANSRNDFGHHDSTINIVMAIIITIFVIFKMAAAAILDFQKFNILTLGPQ